MLCDRFGPLGQNAVESLVGHCASKLQSAEARLNRSPVARRLAMIDIPVLSELVKFTDPKALCLLSCTSKTLHIDLQGTKAWARLAEAQHPPPTPRDDNEARSHVQRRWIAKALPHPRRALEGVTLLEALSRETLAPFEFTRNRFTDFTYFLRLEDSGRLIWEGDLGDLSRESDEEELVLHISMRHANLMAGPGQQNCLGRDSRQRSGDGLTGPL